MEECIGNLALEQAALHSKESETFWRTELQEMTPLRLPHKSSSGPASPGAWRVHRQATRIEPKLLSALQRTANTLAVPIKSVLLAAHLRVLSLLSNQTDVLTLLTSHGRLEQADGDKVCGLFINSLPLRLKLPGGTWTE